MIGYAIGFIIGNVWAIAFMLAAVYNFYFRNEQKPIFYLALLMAGSLGVSQYVYSNWLLFQNDLVEIYYLYWAMASCCIVFAMFVTTKLCRHVFLWPISLAMCLHLMEVVLNITVHIDRNIVALNSSLVANTDLSQSWWLWGVRNSLINFNNVLILATTVVPLSLFSNTAQKFSRYYSSAYMEQSFRRIKTLRELVWVMPDGITKDNAWQCLESAELLLMQWNGNGEDRSHVYCANLLCDRARVLALCSKSTTINYVNHNNYSID